MEKNVKKILLIIFLIQIFSLKILYPQQKLLSLKDCLEIGLKNNREIQLSITRKDISEEKITEISSQLLPQLKFNAGYTRLSDVDPFEVKIPISPNPIKISDVILDNYSLRLSMTQPLFTGFKLINLHKAAKLNYEATENELNKELNEIAFKIQNNYWNLYKANLKKQVIKELLKSAESHTKDAKEFYKNGLINKNDLLKLEVQEGMIRLQLIEIENSINLASLQLLQSIGLSMNEEVNIDMQEIVSMETDLDFSTIINEALKNRNDLKAISNRIEANDKLVSSSIANYFPNLFLFGNIYYNNPNQRYQPIKNEFKTTWDLGITLSWDVWNWGFTSSQVSQSKYQKAQTEIMYSQLKDMITLEAKQSYLTLKRMYEKLKIEKSNLEQADENYRITNEKFKEHIIPISDLIDAETMLIQAKTNYSYTIVDIEIEKVRLNKILGRNIY